MSKLPLSPESVAEIVSILDGSGYSRLDIKTDAFHLRIQREAAAGSMAGQPLDGWSQDWDFSAKNAPDAIEAVALVEELPAGMCVISAPLPGVFYRAPQPGSPPFVEIGSTVTKDTVVGIIETMKLMNPVHAGCAGVIEAISAENGTMVDGAAPLMHVFLA